MSATYGVGETLCDGYPLGEPPCHRDGRSLAVGMISSALDSQGFDRMAPDFRNDLAHRYRRNGVSNRSAARA